MTDAELASIEARWLSAPAQDVRRVMRSDRRDVPALVAAVRLLQRENVLLRASASKSVMRRLAIQLRPSISGASGALNGEKDSTP